MTLVNIDRHIIWHRKMHVPLMETFVGRSTWVPAPCAQFIDYVDNPKILAKKFGIQKKSLPSATKLFNMFYKLQRVRV